MSAKLFGWRMKAGMVAKRSGPYRRWQLAEGAEAAEAGDEAVAAALVGLLELEELDRLAQAVAGDRVLELGQRVGVELGAVAGDGVGADLVERDLVDGVGHGTSGFDAEVRAGWGGLREAAGRGACGSPALFFPKRFLKNGVEASRPRGGMAPGYHNPPAGPWARSAAGSWSRPRCDRRR